MRVDQNEGEKNKVIQINFAKYSRDVCNPIHIRTFETLICNQRRVKVCNFLGGKIRNTGALISAFGWGGGGKGRRHVQKSPFPSPPTPHAGEKIGPSFHARTIL